MMQRNITGGKDSLVRATPNAHRIDLDRDPTLLLDGAFHQPDGEVTSDSDHPVLHLTRILVPGGTR
jgi:hypothetical protein